MHVKFCRTSFRCRKIVVYGKIVWEEACPTLPVLEEEGIYRTRDGVNVPYFRSTVIRITEERGGPGERGKK